MSRVLTPAFTLFSAFAINVTVRYLAKDFQQIFKTVLEASVLSSAPQPLVFPEKPCKKSLKARFSNLYYDKIYMECYNFY